MNAKNKMEEARDILHAVITGREGSYDKRLTRAARLLDLALDDFFESEDDVAVLVFPTEPDGGFPAA
jgi:hypothetical protein